ncbi:hypothetical protein BKA56DRAFT_286079 [Ilyonectria sp. MPI-CAGE-AT-0026]|nr:hypothetical protein BKA56DRAFT_286079 [Ilyonectria sp. MPI-CAGE-AT-0026]
MKVPIFSYTTLVEQLFLDVTLDDAINKPAGTPVVEPWATMYVDAILESRFGDAVWARYHIFGDLVNGLVDGRLTVLESIKEDAIGYRVGYPDIYFDTLPFYRNTNSTDGHPEVIQIILDAASVDVSAYPSDTEIEECRLSCNLE